MCGERESCRVGTEYSHTDTQCAGCVRYEEQPAENLGRVSGPHPEQGGPEWEGSAFAPTDWAGSSP